MWKIWQTSYLPCVSCVDKLNVLLLYLSSARFKSGPLLRTFCLNAAKTKWILQQDENIFSELFCQLVTCNWNASTLRAHSKSEISCILVRFPNLYSMTSWIPETKKHFAFEEKVAENQVYKNDKKAVYLKTWSPALQSLYTLDRYSV